MEGERDDEEEGVGEAAAVDARALSSWPRTPRQSRSSRFGRGQSHDIAWRPVHHSPQP